MMKTEEEAKAWLQTLPEYDTAAQQRCEILVDLLCEENSRQNLVSAASLDSVWLRHIVDSAQLLQDVPRETSVWLDLGTGAGFPGLVIAALRPDMQVFMVESRNRRIEWLNRAAQAMGLSQAQVLGQRLELVETCKVDVISARAFAPLDKLLDLSTRFSTPNTLWLLPKGRSATHELETLVGWDHLFHVEPSLTDAEAGIIKGRVVGQRGRQK